MFPIDVNKWYNMEVVDQQPSLVNPSQKGEDIYPMNVIFPNNNDMWVTKDLKIVQAKMPRELEEDPKWEELPFGVGSLSTVHP